ncbi:MAG TPA: glycosyltransferase family 2 protein [Sphingomicrobium sp.]|nr:glycosyltransferase family 2 protein [Sphingomicrobium sp.]
MKISIAMTTYNGAAFLREQLDSILAQTRIPDELIVCDDQSSDATSSTLNDYAARSPFPIKVLINDERLGSTKNFEKAIGLCVGDIVALCDQDDIWRPHKLAAIERRFEEEPDLGLVFTNADLIDHRGARRAGDLWASFQFDERRQRQLRGLHPYDLLLSRSFVTGATVAFRSRFKSLCLPIPSGIATFVHDRWIALLIAAVGQIDFIADKLIEYRLHPQQQLGVGKLPRPLRYTAPHHASSDRDGLAAIRERLTGSPGWTAKPDFLRALDVRERHVAARAALPRNVVGRLKRIASEYGSGRYHRYSRGSLMALKDLLVGTR